MKSRGADDDVHARLQRLEHGRLSVFSNIPIHRHHVRAVRRHRRRQRVFRDVQSVHADAGASPNHPP